MLITACKQYCPAAGATQGNIAYTQTVTIKYIKTTTPNPNTNLSMNKVNIAFSFNIGKAF
jgi:hypothetical protein